MLGNLRLYYRFVHGRAIGTPADLEAFLNEWLTRSSSIDEAPLSTMSRGAPSRDHASHQRLFALRHDLVRDLVRDVPPILAEVCVWSGLTTCWGVRRAHAVSTAREN